MSLLQQTSNKLLCLNRSSSMHVLDVGTEFLFFVNSYVIAKSKLDVANLELFILSHEFVPPKQSITLMPFCGPLYSRSGYLNNLKYKHSISMHSMCMNDYVSINFNRKILLYINGCPWTYGNIAGFINISRSSLFNENCSFEEPSNENQGIHICCCTCNI